MPADRDATAFEERAARYEHGWLGRLHREVVERTVRIALSSRLAFDQYLLGPGTSDTAILAAEQRPLVSRPGGWIAPVVLLRGRVAGLGK